jgi:hypothetical protein
VADGIAADLPVMDARDELRLVQPGSWATLDRHV